jgi:hypothetical protein
LLQLSRALTGPAAFPLERLLAIYEALLIEHIGDEIDGLDGKERDNATKDWPKEVGRVQLAGTVGCFSLGVCSPFFIDQQQNLLCSGIPTRADAAPAAHIIYRR